MEDLRGVKVLIDGYNVELKHGTGIKTYGLTLIKALKLLGADVHVLFSNNKVASIKKNRFLEEVLFFDCMKRNSNNKINLAKNIFKILCGFSRTQSILLGEVVIKREWENDLSFPMTIFNLPDCYKSANVLFKILGITSKIKTPERVDVWHATCPIPINIKGSKKITTIHDVIPLRLPYTTLEDKKFFYNLVKESIRNSTIIAVSENTKRDILNLFDVDPDNIFVTYETISIKPFINDQDKITSFLKKFGLSFDGYILFVGAIEPKKNVGRLIDAYSMIDTDMPLVIVGKKAWLWEGEIGKLEGIFGKDFPKKVKLLEYVCVTDLSCLYQGAYCFVFPSLYEGFGLPPLEAMSFGCPVITSNVASLPEICGEAALYVDPYNIIDIRNKIEDLLNNSQLRMRLSEAGRERAKLFSMENYIKRVYEVYSKVLS